MQCHVLQYAIGRVAVQTRDRRFTLGFEEEQTPFESPSQNARVWTEKWMRKWIFCPACGNDEIDQYENNRPASDFHCPACREQYELKSKKGKFSSKVVDGAYKTLCERLTSDTNPNFAFLSYNLAEKSVENLFVVPKHFVVPAIIEERPPLAMTARRAGWIGCNIRLNEIPASGKIFIVRDGLPQQATAVRKQWQETLFLRDTSLAARGWLIDVMSCCEAIGTSEFSLDDVYAFEDKLARAYPDNNNVRPKIRQQLQFLRDHGYLVFVGRGRYRLL
jgi:type II restriction enzyme